jgi:hypothetical protein
MGIAYMIVCFLPRIIDKILVSYPHEVTPMKEVCQEPPNGLLFSCREHAAKTCQKANDLAREAVGCNGGLGRHALVWP